MLPAGIEPPGIKPDGEADLDAIAPAGLEGELVPIFDDGVLVAEFA